MKSRHITIAHKDVKDANAAMDLLFDLFPDHYPIIFSEDSNSWTFNLHWPPYPRWYIDSNVVPLAYELYNLQIEAIASFYQTQKLGKVDFVFSMFHSRALIAASSAQCRRHGVPLSHIIHVDAHTDLMPPVLYSSNLTRTLCDPIFYHEVNIAVPESVIAAIDLGSISKGNFLTTYLLATSPGKLIHVCETLEEREASLVPTVLDFNLAGRHISRMGVSIQKEISPECWQFQQTRFLPRNLSLKKDDTVWLDIDLDAFCNRYDGDSCKRLQKMTSAEHVELVQRIARFLQALSHADWISHIEAISIAVSPGFFPTDYWNYTIPTICNAVKRIIYYD